MMNISRIYDVYWFVQYQSVGEKVHRNVVDAYEFAPRNRTWVSLEPV